MKDSFSNQYTFKLIWNFKLIYRTQLLHFFFSLGIRPHEQCKVLSSHLNFSVQRLLTLHLRYFFDRFFVSSSFFASPAYSRLPSWASVFRWHPTTEIFLKKILCVDFIAQILAWVFICLAENTRSKYFRPVYSDTWTNPSDVFSLH